MQTLFQKLGAIVVGVAITVGGWLGYHQPEIQVIDVPQVEQEQTFGADTNLFVGGFPYYLAGSGITSSATSFTLTSLTLPQNSYPIQDSDLSSTFYITFEPGSKTRQEFASCTTVGANTGGNVTISGCTRGLSAVTPYTASTTQRFSHAGGTSVIFSNPPQLYDSAAFKGNDESITGVWTFNSQLPVSTLIATGTTQFVTKAYADAIANAGAATSTESTTGIVRLATAIQQASSTASTANTGLAIQAEHATSTPGYSCDASGTSGALCIPVAKNNGKLSQSWLDLTESFSFSGNNTLSGNNTHSGTNLFTASTTLTATTTILANSVNTALVLNGIDYIFPSSEGASSTVLMTNGSGGLSWNTEGWQLLGETTLSAPASSISVSSFSAKKNLYATINIPISSGASQDRLTFNSSAINYYWRYSVNNGAYVLDAGTNSRIDMGFATTAPRFYKFDIDNSNATSSKFIIFNGATANASTTPAGFEGTAMWETPGQITTMTLTASTGTFGTSTRMIIWGR